MTHQTKLCVFLTSHLLIMASVSKKMTCESVSLVLAFNPWMSIGWVLARWSSDACGVPDPWAGSSGPWTFCKRCWAKLRNVARLWRLNACAKEMVGFTVVFVGSACHFSSQAAKISSAATPCTTRSRWPRIHNEKILSLTHWGLATGSTLAQVMAWCLMAPSHYLNQCWPIISEVNVAFTSGQFHRKCSRYLSLICFWKFLIQECSHISQVSMS